MDGLNAEEQNTAIDLLKKLGLSVRGSILKKRQLENECRFFTFSILNT